MLKKKDARVRELETQLEETREEISGLRSALEEAAGRNGRTAALEAETAELRAQQADATADAQATGDTLQEAVAKYREVRLYNAPDIPEDLVPPSRTLAEIDRHFERAERVVEGVRARLTEEEKGKAALRPFGTLRRYPDDSSLSPSEKIRVGLQRLAEAE